MGLDTVELLFAVEKRFSVEIPNAEAATLGTVGDLLFWLRRELDRQGRTDWGDEALFQELRRVIAEHSGVPLEDIVPEARWAEDLRLD